MASRFTLDIKQFTDKLEQRAGTVLRRAALGVFTDIVRGTPVDTGRARGNWQLTVNAPPPAATETTDPGGNQAIASATTAVRSADIGDTVTISNNLPYIRELENGRSLQAPSGMVRVALVDWPARVDAVARDTDR